jgi:inner membrane protein
MEGLTHTLSGVVVSSLGIRQGFGPTVTAAFIISTVFPDIDFLAMWINRYYYLRYHRGITHSLLGILVFSFFIALIFYLSNGHHDFKILYLVSLAGMAIHVGFDLLNSYGTQILLPFCSQKYSLDLDIIFDLWFIGPLILGSLAIYVFPKNQRIIALLILVLILVSVAFRYVQRQRAIGLMRIVQSEKPLATFPAGMESFYNPFLWRGVILGDEGYRLYEVNTSRRKITSSKVRSCDRVILGKYMSRSELLKTFLSWARFPFATIDKDDSGITILCGDLRFASSKESNYFLLRIRLDQEGNEISSRFSFRGI